MAPPVVCDKHIMSKDNDERLSKDYLGVNNKGGPGGAFKFVLF